MTLVLVGSGHALGGLPSKMDVIWVLGICICTCIAQAFFRVQRIGPTRLTKIVVKRHTAFYHYSTSAVQNLL